MDFVSVGRVDEFPQGHVRGFKIEGEFVAVVRVDESFYAFENRCTHMDVDIADADLEGMNLTCWFHGSVFDVETGKAVVGPAYRPLERYSVRVQGDDVLVGKE
jgi:3-phenylpropionate/trans-cinnamate dioxygenase ferredoxin subunit